MSMHKKKERKAKSKRKRKKSEGERKEEEAGKEAGSLFSLYRRCFLYSNKMKYEVKWCKCGLQRKEGGAYNNHKLNGLSDLLEKAWSLCCLCVLALCYLLEETSLCLNTIFDEFPSTSKNTSSPEKGYFFHTPYYTCQILYCTRYSF